MNRRKFLLNSVMTSGALALFPLSTLGNTNVETLPCLTKIINQTGSFSLNNLPFGFSKASAELLVQLKQDGYAFNVNNVVKLNDNCFAISIEKNSLLGFKNNELALLVKEGLTSKYYILEEKIANEFNQLIESYTLNMNAIGIKGNVADFAFPVKVTAVKNGRTNIFSYKNNLENTITFKSSKKGAKVIVS